MNLHVDVSEKIFQAIVLASYLRKHKEDLKKASKAANDFFHDKKMGVDFYATKIQSLFDNFKFQIEALSLKGDKQHLKAAASFAKKQWEIVSLALCLEISSDNYPFFLINPFPFEAITQLILNSTGKSRINTNQTPPSEPYVLFNVKIQSFKAIELTGEKNLLLPAEMGLLSMLTPGPLAKGTIIDPCSGVIFSETQKNIQFSVKNEKMVQDYLCISAELRLSLEKLSA